MKNKNHINTEDFSKVSQHFEIFIHIAKNIVFKVSHKSVDFFEGEEELYNLLGSFLQTKVISENEYYDLLSQPFENSVYRLLKKLYFEGFFSGNICQVEEVKDILASLASLLCIGDIDNIREYFKLRYDTLISKEKQVHIVPLVGSILDIMLEPDGDIWMQEQHLVWDLIEIAKKYDPTGHIVRLYGLGNRPYVAAFECLHFLLINNFLQEDNNIEARTYHYLKEIYSKNKIGERLQELDSFIDSRRNGIDTENILDTPSAKSHSKRVYNVVVRSSKQLFSEVRFGKYGEKEEKMYANLLLFLYSEKIISDEQYQTASDVRHDVSSVFYMLSILSNKGFFNKHQELKKGISDADKNYELVLSEEDFVSLNETDTDQINTTIHNFTETALILIEENSIQELEDFLYNFLDYLLENNVIDDYIPSKDTSTACIAYIKKLEEKGFYKQAPKILKKIHSFLKTYSYE